MDRRELDLRDFDALIAELDRLLASGYDRTGQWDLAAICRHLNIAMTMTMDGFKFKAPLVFRILGPMVRGSFFRTRKIKPGLKAPSGTLFESAGDDAAAVAQFKATIERFRGFGPINVAHPFMGQLTTDQWHDFHLIHASHHLSFLVPKPPQEPSVVVSQDAPRSAVGEAAG